MEFIKIEANGLKTLNIITNDYGYTLSTYQLSEEQLLQLDASIDFSG
ncbi:hypothetical protein [Gracilibacillus timonensis]|nr:hypothetical protein [Gracilibacillus timonensis]